MATHTFTSVKPWCAPARVYVEKAFKPLGIKAKYGRVVHAYDLPSGGKSDIPTSQTQDITVSQSQAEWASYVLGALRSQTAITFGNIYDMEQHNQGAARSTIPMPWLYDKGGKPITDDIKACVASLPESKQEAARKASTEVGVVQSRGLLYGHEGRKAAKRASSKGPAKSKSPVGLRESIASFFHGDESKSKRRRTRQRRRGR